MSTTTDPSPSRFTRRSPWLVLLYSVLTIGVYLAVWYYRVNRELRDYGGRFAHPPHDENPLHVRPWLAVLAISPLALLLLFIPAWVSTYRTGRRVQRAEELAGSPARVDMGTGGILFWLGGTLMPFWAAYLQSHLNQLSGHDGAHEAVRDEWRPDPAGRHEYRYWTGDDWSDWVADAGVQSLDPLLPVAAAPVATPATKAATKTCPDCAEEVKPAAAVCRFCGHRFEPAAEHPAELEEIDTAGAQDPISGSPMCAECGASFPWDDAFQSQETPGSAPVNPPGHGTFRPRAYCPRCGALVAEWHIDAVRDHDEWTWYGANAAANVGAALPPGPLQAWGKQIPLALLPVVEEHRLDVERVRATEAQTPTPEPSSTAAAQERLQDAYRMLHADRLEDAHGAIVDALAAGLDAHDYSCAMGSLGFLYLWNHGDVPRAFRYCRESVEWDAGAYWQAQYVLSLVYARTGDAERAEHALRNAKRYALTRWWDEGAEERLRRAADEWFASHDVTALMQATA